VKRSYEIGFDGSGIDDFIKGIEEYKKWLKSRSEILLRKLADEGYQIAAAGFQNAQYDGTNDSAVSVEERGENIRAIVAIGSVVLFIEFGTGITYPDTHPEAAQNGMVRGGYGQGKGKQSTWGYYGEPGTNGVVRTNPKTGRTVVLTHGNPANMPMYEAVKQLRERLPELVREVFGSD
jgi:hypothetical protein